MAWHIIQLVKLAMKHEFNNDDKHCSGLDSEINNIKEIKLLILDHFVKHPHFKENFFNNIKFIDYLICTKSICNMIFNIYQYASKIQYKHYYIYRKFIQTILKLYGRQKLLHMEYF